MNEKFSVGFLLVDGFEALDLTGPRSVFQIAQSQKTVEFEFWLIGVKGTSAVSECGLRLELDHLLVDAPTCDILFIPGGQGSRQLALGSADRQLVCSLIDGSKITASVCTGAYLLAQLGYLDGRKSAIHWAFETDFRKRYPNVSVDGTSLYRRHEKFWTSGGITAGIDMSLSILSHLTSSALSASVARMLNLYIHRPGHQAQFSAPLQWQLGSSKHISTILDTVLANPRKPYTIQDLADIAGLSTRTLLRRLQEQVGMSPSRFLERIRLDLARQMLCKGSDTLDLVADRVGFTNTDSFSRAFERVFEVRPSIYRSLFSEREIQ